MKRRGVLTAVMLLVLGGAWGGVLLTRTGFVTPFTDGQYTSPHLHKLSVGPFAALGTERHTRD